uniref:Uncharacterized protein n=1 Tax=Cupriavidus taiwanensis TaxID=164546 RepID=A0A375HAL6_9BURK|nr:protein of unknown function [Cupriavidus taiwanensis]
MVMAQIRQPGASVAGVALSPRAQPEHGAPMDARGPSAADADGAERGPRVCSATGGGPVRSQGRGVTV